MLTTTVRLLPHDMPIDHQRRAQFQLSPLAVDRLGRPLSSVEEEEEEEEEDGDDLFLPPAERSVAS